MNDNLVFQHYLVVFIDLLGQRETLREITDIPVEESEKQHFIEVMRKSVGRVINVREIFKNFFDSAPSYVTNVNAVPPELQAEFIASQKVNEIHYYSLSDAVVIAVPLMTDNDNCSAVNAIYYAFIAAAGIGLLSLSVGVPMRAGLEVGVATKIDDNEIYGPALERAYFLESNLAEYPRCLVGSGLVNYLLWVENNNCKTKTGMVAKGMAHIAEK